MISERDMQHGCDWNGEDLTGWYASEKFDGVRLWWDGKVFWTRSGREIKAPSTFTPKTDFEYEAELYPFQPARNAVNHGKWDSVLKLQFFDAPKRPGDWFARVSFDTIRPITAVKLKSTEEAIAFTKEIQSRGGEGLIARKPGVSYTPGCTRNILKLTKNTFANLTWKQRKDFGIS